MTSWIKTVAAGLVAGVAVSAAPDAAAQVIVRSERIKTVTITRDVVGPDTGRDRPGNHTYNDEGPPGRVTVPMRSRLEDLAAVVGMRVTSHDYRAALVSRTTNVTEAWDGLVRFNLDPVLSNPDQTALTLKRATLVATVDSDDAAGNSDAGTTGPMTEIRDLTASIESVPLVNVPPVSSRALSESEAKQIGATVWDVTNLVRRWLTNPTRYHGIQIKGGAPTRGVMGARGLTGAGGARQRSRSFWVRQREFRQRDGFWEYIALYQLSDIQLILAF